MEMAKNINLCGENFLIRRYDSARDEQKVLELWKTVFFNEMPFDLWHWKYIGNPYETAIIICENEKGLPAVLYGGIPFKSNYCGREIKMIHLSDIMSHPDYRGSGLFIHTANTYFDIFGKTDDDTFAMYGFPGKYHFDIGAKYLKYSPIGAGSNYFSGSTVQLAKENNLTMGQITHVKNPDTCFDRIWQGLSRNYPFSVIRDSAYMKWRFFNHPQNNYEVWCFKSDLKADYGGYMVIHIKGEKAAIVDILVPESVEIFHAFMGKISEILLKKGVQKLETWVPGDHFLTEMLLNTSGFKNEKEPIGIIPTIRIFDDSVKLNWACENIFYTMGDGDLL